MGLLLARAGLLSGGAGEVGDLNPSFSNVHYLYSFTAITSQREEIKDLTIWNNGCTVSTAQKHFGNNSTYYNSSDFVGNDGTTDERALMRFNAAGDFVLEGWCRQSGTVSNNRMIGAVYKFSNNSRNWQLRILGNTHGTDPGKIRFTLFPNGSDASDNDQTVDSGVAVPQNTWFHWALQRKGTGHIIFIDGVPGTKMTTGYRPSGTGTDAIRWGRDNDGSHQYAGHMSDFRVTLGEAFYPEAGFTPPTAIWPRS